MAPQAQADEGFRHWDDEKCYHRRSCRNSRRNRNRNLKVSDLVKVISLDFSDIDEFNILARRETEKDMNERLTFIRSAVNCIMDS